MRVSKGEWTVVMIQTLKSIHDLLIQTDFKQFIPYLSKESIIIFDDISWSAGMRRAWDKIERNKNVKISVNLKKFGICLIDNNIKNRYSIQIPLF